MSPYRKPPRSAISQKDRQFEDLLRRAYDFLSRPQPIPAVTKPKKKQSKVA
jgi:hypothetical protein